MNIGAGRIYGMPVSQMSEEEYRLYCQVRGAALRRISNRRKLVLGLLFSFIVLLLSLFVFTLRGEALTQEDGETWYKYATFHRVTCGETWESIAEDYADDLHYADLTDYVRELREVNRIYDTGTEPVPGTELVVQYYSTERK